MKSKLIIISFLFSCIYQDVYSSYRAPRVNACSYMGRILDKWWNEDTGPIIRSEDYPETYEVNVFTIPLDGFQRRDFRRGGTVVALGAVALAAAFPPAAIPILLSGFTTTTCITLPLILYDRPINAPQSHPE